MRAQHVAGKDDGQQQQQQQRRARELAPLFARTRPGSGWSRAETRREQCLLPCRRRPRYAFSSVVVVAVALSRRVRCRVESPSRKTIAQQLKKKVEQKLEKKKQKLPLDLWIYQLHTAP